MKRPQASQLRPPLCVLVFALALLSLGVMKGLPYTTFLMANTDTTAAASDPSHQFSIGPVRWEIEQFSRARELAPFRRYFFETCGGQTGTQAAMCISQGLGRAFHPGIPKHEFLERHFDPVADFKAHLAGEPGHCVNQSGMLATTLLSVGIPARVVSFVPRTGWGGHTMVEVWAGSDWVSVDPTEIGLVGSIRPSSAVEIKQMSGSLRLFSEDGSILQDPYVLSKSIADGELVYPEPWLYMRTGPRFSFWPFRGEFVQVGMHGWRFSTALLLCRVAFVISIFVGLYLLAGLLYSSNRMVVAVPQLRPASDRLRPASDKGRDNRVRPGHLAS